MFELKTAVLVLFLNAAAPVPYGDAVTFPFVSRAECEAQSLIYGARVATVVAGELKRSRKRAKVAGVESKCLPFGVQA